MEENKKIETVKIEVEGFQCKRCGGKWIPHSVLRPPAHCPKCNTPYWNRERKKPRIVVGV